MKFKSKLLTIYQHRDGRIEIISTHKISVSKNGKTAFLGGRKSESK